MPRFSIAPFVAVLGALSVAGSVSAGEAQRQAELIERLAPQDRQAFVERLIARQQRERAASADATLDVTPPVLTLFNSGTTLNLAKSAAPFKFQVKVSDDLSGVALVYAQAIGPSGQTLYGYADGSHPVRSLTAYGGFGTVSRLLEPGTWKFVYAYGYDVAGNFFDAGEAELAALGNSTFTIVNNSGYDLAKPGLTSGKILTGAVSLSARAPGTDDVNLSAGVKITATDVGNTALSGVKQGNVTFCQIADPNKCIYLFGYVYATGLATANFTATAQVSSQGATAGDYELRVVHLTDHAGNGTSLVSNKFGGPIDFSTLFPSTVIKIKP